MQKIKRVTIFRIGMPWDIFRAVIQSRGIKLRSRRILNMADVKDVRKDDLVVRWKLSNGAKVTFARGKGPTGKGKHCYRLTEIVYPEHVKKAKKRKR